MPPDPPSACISTHAPSSVSPPIVSTFRRLWDVNMYTSVSVHVCTYRWLNACDVIAVQLHYNSSSQIVNPSNTHTYTSFFKCHSYNIQQARNAPCRGGPGRTVWMCGGKGHQTAFTTGKTTTPGSPTCRPRTCKGIWRSSMVRIALFISSTVLCL